MVGRGRAGHRGPPRGLRARPGPGTPTQWGRWRGAPATPLCERVPISILPPPQDGLGADPGRADDPMGTLDCSPRPDHSAFLDDWWGFRAAPPPQAGEVSVSD